jgi:hypothetical protein
MHHVVDMTKYKDAGCHGRYWSDYSLLGFGFWNCVWLTYQQNALPPSAQWQNYIQVDTGVIGWSKWVNYPSSQLQKSWEGGCHYPSFPNYTISQFLLAWTKT